MNDDCGRPRTSAPTATVRHRYKTRPPLSTSTSILHLFKTRTPLSTCFLHLLSLLPLLALATAHAAPTATTAISAHAYVRSGALGIYDAIENVGFGQHDGEATAWKDLAGTLGDISLSSRSDATWQNDRLDFTSSTGFLTANKVTLTDLTIEIATRPHGNIRRFDAESWVSTFESWYNDSEGELERISNTRICAGARLFDVDQIFVTTYISKLHTARSYTTNGTARLTPFKTATGNNATALSNSRIKFLPNSGSRAYFIRVYNRGLSDQELAWNLNLDCHRYFGQALSDLTLDDRRIDSGQIDFRYLVSTSSAGGGTTTLTVDGVSHAEGEAVWLPLNETTDVTFQAVPSAGSVFAGWSGDTDGFTAAELRQPTLVVSNTRPRALTARFVESSSTNLTAYDYERTGLIAQWDAIENAGYGSHSTAPSAWAELVNGAAVTHVGALTYNASNVVFGGSSYFMSHIPAVQTALAAKSMTVQLFLCPKEYTSGAGYLHIGDSIVNRELVLDMRQESGTASAYGAFSGLQYASEGWYDVAHCCIPVSTTSCFGKDTLATIRVDADGAKIAFDGGANVHTNCGMGVAPTNDLVSIGWYYNNGKPKFTLYSVRFYDRALTDDEVRYNETMDIARFVCPGRICRDGTSFTCRFEASAEEGGTVSLNGGGESSSTNAWISSEGTVTLVATPSAGMKFRWWTGEVKGMDESLLTQATLVLPANRPRALHAVFTDGTPDPVARTWSGAVGDGIWGRIGNWDPQGTPSEGDAVTIPSGSTVTCDGPTAAIGSLSVAGTLKMKNWMTCVTSETVTVEKNGVIAVYAAFSSSEMSNRVWIACSDLDVKSGGKINADCLGYVYRDGPGWAVQSCTSDYYGGAYGGYAADGQCRTYCTADEPLYAGSGGGLAGRTAGGAIRIAATGTVTVDGTISANGSATVIWAGGGASGGGVYISCRTLAGGGTISASGNDNVGANGHCGGGGGRIAVHYNAAAQLSADCRIRFAAKGGIGSYGGTPSRVQGVGNPGTLWFTDDQLLTNATYATLGWRFAGEWHSGSGATRLVIPNDVLMDAAATLFVPPLSEVVFEGDLSVIGQYSAANVAGGKNVNVHVGGDLLVEGARMYQYGARLRVDGDLNLGKVKPTWLNAAELYLAAAPTNSTTGPWGCDLSVGQALTFNTNTIAYFGGASANGAIPRVTARDVRQMATATLTADGLGWAARQGPGRGPSSGHSWAAGYGGRGASNGYLSQANATVYGSMKRPLALGSSSAYRGGGAIYVTAERRMRVDGTITANGVSAGRWAPAGSGGSIYLAAKSFQPSTATLTATGGGSGDGYDAFEGGGGRIAIWRYHGETNGLSISVAPGAWYTGWSCTYPAQAGTIYVGRLPGPMCIIVR